MVIFAVVFIFGGCNTAHAQDDPSGYTTNYKLRLYDEGAYPTADSINQNWVDIDLSLKARQNTIDSLKTSFTLLHTPTGSLKQSVVIPYNTSNSFFWKYFYKYTAPDEEIYWRLNTDLTQFDDDTLKIKDGVFPLLSGTNTWSGQNTFTGLTSFDAMNYVTFTGGGATIGLEDLAGLYYNVPSGDAHIFQVDGNQVLSLGDLASFIPPTTFADSVTVSGNLKVTGTDGALYPSLLNNSQENLLTVSKGGLIYNTDLDKFRGFGSDWMTLTAEEIKNTFDVKQTFSDTVLFNSYVRFGTNPTSITGNPKYYFDDDIAIGRNTIEYPVFQYDLSASTLYLRNTAGNFGLELAGGTNPVMGSYGSGQLSIRHRNSFYNEIKVSPNSTGNKTVVDIGADGDFKIGTTDNGAYPFQVNGDSYQKGALVMDGTVKQDTGYYTYGTYSASGIRFNGGNVFTITQSSSTLDEVDPSTVRIGQTIVLYFSNGGITVRSGRESSGVGFQLTDTDWVTSAGDMLTLTYIGGYFRESGRADFP